MTQEKKIDVERKPASAEAEPESVSPLVDVYQAGDGAIVLEAELPGARAEDVDVRVDRGVLTIEAEARIEPPGEDYAGVYTGFTGGRYFRAFALSDEVDREAIEASLSAGVLTVRMPRAAAPGTTKVEIRGG